MKQNHFSVELTVMFALMFGGFVAYMLWNDKSISAIGEGLATAGIVLLLGKLIRMAAK